MTSPHEAAALRRAEAMAQRADRPRHRRAAEHPQGDPVRLTECRSVEPDGHRWAVVGPARLEVRDSATEGKPIFHGVASVTERGYEVWDVFGPYTEVIAEDAFDEDLARADLDVPLVIGHDQIRRIGRTTAGDVRLYRGPDGLTVDSDLNMADFDTAYIVPKMRAKWIDEMSFAFRLDAGEWSPDFTQYRVTKATIHRGDVAIVGYGANPFTSAGLEEAAAESPARQDAAAGIQARDESSAATVALGDDLPAEPLPTEREDATPMSDTAPAEVLAAEVVEPTNELSELRAAVAKLTEDARMRANAQEAHVNAPAYDEVARVGAEPRTYTPDAARTEGRSFIVDFAAAQLGDYSAQARLARHAMEERVERAKYFSRDIGTGAFAGLTVPQYLIDQFAPLARAGRPLADNCRKLDLPADGMTVTISRATTGTSAAIQATEAAGVSETNFDDTELVVNVRTIAGQQDVSFQALARSVGAEGVIVSDLVAAYHTTLDSQIINADGNSGTHLGIRSTGSISTATLTDSSPTPAEALGSLYEIQSTIETAVYKVPTHFVMHPRRWMWFCAAVGTDTALIGQGTQYPPQWGDREVGSPYGAGVRGDIAGLPVIVDANVPTNVSSTQDVILAVNANELFLWEDPGAPLFIRAEQPGAGNLMTKLVVYGYSAFTAGRYPAAHGVISGSGLAAPTAFGKTIS
jgi:HK97 family phage prohead protease/HK97 family phage major capsid protein